MSQPLSPEELADLYEQYAPSNPGGPVLGSYHYVPTGIGLNHLLTSSGTVPRSTVSGTSLSGDTIQNWMTALESQSRNVTSSNQSSVDMWYVVQMPGGDYADNLYEHPEIPMMVPKKGRFIGIARTKDEMEKMTNDWDENQPNTSGKPRHVYLVYKIQIRGVKQMLETLEFFHSRGMLQRQE